MYTPSLGIFNKFSKYNKQRCISNEHISSYDLEFTSSYNGFFCSFICGYDAILDSLINNLILFYLSDSVLFNSLISQNIRDEYFIDWLHTELRNYKYECLILFKDDYIDITCHKNTFFKVRIPRDVIER